MSGKRSGDYVTFTYFFMMLKYCKANTFTEFGMNLDFLDRWQVGWRLLLGGWDDVGYGLGGVVVVGSCLEMG